MQVSKNEATTSASFISILVAMLAAYAFIMAGFTMMAGVSPFGTVLTYDLSAQPDLPQAASIEGFSLGTGVIAKTAAILQTEQATTVVHWAWFSGLGLLAFGAGVLVYAFMRILRKHQSEA